MTASDGPLLAAHAAVHAWLEERLYLALEALVRSELSAARAHVDGFAAVLAEHMAWEDARVLPAYREVAPADGPGRADHVAGDHVVLVRALAAVREALDALQARDVTREILVRLPVVYRLIGTLEHHTAREQKSVYPAVARALSPQEIDDVTAALTGLVERASAT